MPTDFSADSGNFRLLIFLADGVRSSSVEEDKI